MAGERLDSLVLQKCFDELSKIIIPAGGFPFFGTLLGLTRNGMMIQGDDDIDFACDSNMLFTIVVLIESNFNVLTQLDIVDHETGAGAISMVLKFDDNLVHLDIYSYISNDSFCIFPVHWTDQRSVVENWLKVPAELIDACRKYLLIKSSDFKITDLEELCGYLYGNRWKESLRKNVDYVHILKDGVPFIRSTTKKERYLGKYKSFYSNLYWKYQKFLKA
jgi:hypothetical protein